MSQKHVVKWQPFLGSLFKKAIPLAGKAIKSLASSSIVKDTTKKLSKNAVSALGDVVADVIAGEDPTIKAKENLQKTREDIAQTIREKSKPAETIAQKAKSEKDKKYLKRKNVTHSIKEGSRKKRRKYYIFDDWNNI